MPKIEPYHKSLPHSYAPGIYPAMCLIQSRPEAANRLLLQSGTEGSEGVAKLRAAYAAAGVREEFADRALNRISGKENCHAAGVFEKYDCGLSADRPHVALHQISDAGNLGSILRTCLGFGIRDVAAIRPCVDIFDPRAVRASMGAFFMLNVRAYDDFDEYREAFPSHALYPFMLDGAVCLNEAVKNPPGLYSLVFGNEKTGLPDGFQFLGTPVSIPQSHRIDSLNLAAAVAIGVYSFTNGSRL